MGILYQAADPLYWVIWLFILFALMAFNELGRTSLWAGIALFRRALYDANGLRPMIRVLEELGVRDAFDVRAVRETVDCLSGRVLVEYAEYHQVEIEFVYEMFCVVIFGLVGLVKIDPDISDEALMKVVEQTLHLDMEPLALDVSAKRQDSASV